MTLSRAEFFWLAYLWALHLEWLELRRALILLIDKAYAKVGDRVCAMALRGSPLLSGLCHK